MGFYVGLADAIDELDELVVLVAAFAVADAMRVQHVFRVTHPSCRLLTSYSNTLPVPNTAKQGPEVPNEAMHLVCVCVSLPLSLSLSIFRFICIYIVISICIWWCVTVVLSL